MTVNELPSGADSVVVVEVQHYGNFSGGCSFGQTKAEVSEVVDVDNIGLFFLKNSVEGCGKFRDGEVIAESGGFRLGQSRNPEGIVAV